MLVWSAIDAGKAARLIADFEARFPGVRVEYVELSARDIYARFLAAQHSGQPLPDFLWSSAMDLQIKLVNDGYAQSYLSPEIAHVAPWSNWDNQAWGVTAEPIVFVYNRQLISDRDMPTTHSALADYLARRPAPPRATVATYDLPTSAVGYLYLEQDQQASHAMWPLLKQMADNQLHVFANAEQIMRDVESGRAAIGYDIIGSYALDETRRDARLGMVLPQDYTLVVSRIAMIPRGAPHAAAARLFLDFLLSRKGQADLAEEFMPSIRKDVPTPPALAAGEAPQRAIRVGPGLLVDSDQMTRDYVVRRWRQSLAD
ncbi:MAG TPA: ABC transporter substrate-binding protein [Novosphingobium sp.]|nr:ABC transporter substrate-binding protein [Novosphingobium sp.]